MHSRPAVVIWDAWSHLDRAERGRIVVDAFESAGVDYAVRVALGLTQQEALSMGHPPYRIG